MNVVSLLLLSGLVGWLSPAGPSPRRAFVYPTSPAVKATFANEGRLVLVGAQSGQIALFHGRTALLVREFSGHRKPIGDLDSWPDRDTVVSGDAAGTVFFWRTADLGVVQRISLSASIRQIRIRPHSTQAAIAGRRMLWLVDATGSKRLLWNGALGGPDITSIAFSPDGLHLAVGYANGSIVLNNLTTRHQQRLKGPAGPVLAIALGRDSVLAVAGTPVLSVWCRPQSGWAMRAITMPRPLTSLAMTGSRVALGSDTGELTTFSLSSGQEQPVAKSEAPLRSIRQHPREGLLLTTFDSESPKTWRLTEPSAAQP